jgi:hypothetical protein
VELSVVMTPRIPFDGVFMSELLERILGRPLYAAEAGDGGGEPAPEPAAPAPTDADVSDDDAPEADESEEAAEPVDDEDDDSDEGRERREAKAAEAKAKAAEDDEDEVDFGFKKFKLNKELAQVVKGFQADYTQKTQTLAEQRRAAIAEAEEIASTAQERVAAAGKLENADSMIERYMKLDWAALEEQDRQNGQNLAQTRLRELQQWRHVREQYSRNVTDLDAKAAEARNQRALKDQEETLGRVQQAAMTLHRDIPTWSADKDKVAEFAMQTYGFTPQELSSMTDARMGKAFHDAWKLNSIAQKQKTAVQKAAPAKTAPIAPAPLETVAARGSGTGARRSLDQLAKGDDMSAFVAGYSKAYGKRR